MNLSASEYSSSGCESGWTMYLDQSSLSQNRYNGFSRFLDDNYERVEDEEEEEENLSMLSDASSGPPHYYQEDEDFFDQSPKKKKKNDKKLSNEHGRMTQNSYLDDTASSPELNKRITKNKASMEEKVQEFSQGFSATHFKKGKSAAFKNNHFQSSLDQEKSASKVAARKWR